LDSVVGLIVAKRGYLNSFSPHLCPGEAISGSSHRSVCILLDISEPDTMDELCRQFAGFFRYAKILEMVAAGIQSGAIKVPK